MPEKIYRSNKDKIIAGVCGGLAEHYKVDPVWTRLIAVLLVLIDGIGIILYIIAWIILPVNPKQKKTKKTVAEQKLDQVSKSKEVSLLGIIFILLGCAFLAQNMFSWFSFDYVWPVLIIIIGVYLLSKKK